MAQVGIKSKDTTDVVSTVQTQAPQGMSIEEQNELRKLVNSLSERLETVENKKGKDIFEIYKGPRFYSYNTFGEKVIVDFKSEKKDKKISDLVHKNQYGERVSNQWVNILFSDGSTESVDVIDFGMNKVLSEQFEPLSITKAKPCLDGKLRPFYVFDIDGEEVEVAQHAIN